MSQPNVETIIQAIREILETHLDTPWTGELNESTSLIDDLKVDSFDAFNLLLAIEERFDIDISDEEASKITTLKAAIDCILSKLQQKDEQSAAEKPDYRKHVDARLTSETP